VDPEQTCPWGLSECTCEGDEDLHDEHLAAVAEAGREYHFDW
jgi:hypothetical protein